MKTLFWILATACLLVACQKETVNKVPELTTQAITSITSGTASSGGIITTDGGAQITSRGVIWSTTSGATVAVSTKSNDGAGSGLFFSDLTGLNSNTTYFVRAYATNSAGTGYGNEIKFLTKKKPAHFVVTGQVKIITSYGSPGIIITVKNDGESTGYNVSAVVNALNGTVIIDTGTAFPANLRDILPDQSAQDDAIFFKITPAQAVALTYSVPVVTWLSRD